MKRIYQEKGQIIVILALGMVAILGITALAIDGSLLYSQRRNDQNTADSAALAGAGAAAHKLRDFNPSDFSCDPGSTSLARQASDLAVNAAIESALVDGVNLDRYDLSNQNGVTVRCDKDSAQNDYLDIHVMVTSSSEQSEENPTPKIQTYFLQAFSNNSLQTTVEAIARVYPNQPFAYGNALVSLANSCGKNSGGIFFNGNSLTDITSGGIFSNSCVDAGGSTTVKVTGGSVHAYSTTGCNNFTPSVTNTTCSKASEKIPTGILPDPTCPYYGDDAFKKVYSKTSSSIGPGWYPGGIHLKSGYSVELLPGLYCIEGGLSNHAQSKLIGHNVTLYFLDNSSVSLNQNTGSGYGTDLTAPSCATSVCGVPHAVEGLLMYFKTGQAAQVTINGGSNNNYTGTIYGENTNFTINGGTEISSFNTQIIGNYIYVSGNAKLIMDLDSKKWVQYPASLSLIK